MVLNVMVKEGGKLCRKTGWCCQERAQCSAEEEASGFKYTTILEYGLREGMAIVRSRYDRSSAVLRS